MTKPTDTDDLEAIPRKLDELQRRHPDLAELLEAYRARRREYDALFPHTSNRPATRGDRPARRRYRV